MTARRRIATPFPGVLLLAGVLLASQFGGISGRTAAPSPSCGAGYVKKGTQTTSRGTLTVSYNKSLKKACAHFVKKANRGTATSMGVILDSRHNGTLVDSERDSGRFKYYAGPVYAKVRPTRGCQVGATGSHRSVLDYIGENCGPW